MFALIRTALRIARVSPIPRARAASIMARTTVPNILWCHRPAVLVATPPTPRGNTTRAFSSSASDDAAHRARLNRLADLFVEAREEVSYAEESKGTTYYNEEVRAP